MSETLEDKLERAERLLQEVKEGMQVKVADPCKATIGGVQTSLTDPADPDCGLRIGIVESEFYGLGGLTWDGARELIKVLQTYIARDK